jgi:hypothetical protein
MLFPAGFGSNLRQVFDNRTAISNGCPEIDWSRPEPAWLSIFQPVMRIYSSQSRLLIWFNLASDCGWQGKARNASGGFTWDTTVLPSGIPSLSSFVHSLGLKFGFYSDGFVPFLGSANPHITMGFQWLLQLWLCGRNSALHWKSWTWNLGRGQFRRLGSRLPQSSFRHSYLRSLSLILSLSMTTVILVTFLIFCLTSEFCSSHVAVSSTDFVDFNPPIQVCG